MMMQRTLLVFLLASAWTTVVVTGFVATKGQTNALAFGGVGVPVSTTQRSPRLWMVGYTASSETEDQARYVLSRAKECAYCSNDEDENDECCSIEECESLLHEMIRLQSRCVTGTLIGQDLCDDQDVVADVVAHLRHKVKTQKQQAIERYVPGRFPCIPSFFLFFFLSLFGCQLYLAHKMLFLGGGTIFTSIPCFAGTVVGLP